MSKNEIRISSGSTIGMNSKQKNWFSDLSQRDISWEELLKMKSAIGESSTGDLPIEWILSAPKTVPFFRFMVSYLVYSFRDELFDHDFSENDEEDHVIKNYIDAIYEELKPRKQKRDKTNRLAEFAYQAFIDNGCETNGSFFGRLYENAPLWTKDDLYHKLFREEDLPIFDFIPIAFGLNMSLDDVNVFLKKALLRGGLDVGDEYELLAYLTFAIATKNKREYFKSLNMLYHSCLAKDSKKQSDISISTASLQEQMQQVISICTGLSPTELHTISELKEFFSIYKANYLTRAQSERVVSKQFWELLKEFKRYEAERIAKFKRDAIERVDEQGRGTVVVVAKPNKSVFIPGGTLWSTEPVIASPGVEPCDPRICKSTDACVIDLNEDSLVEVVVPVESITPGKGSIAYNQTFSCSLPDLRDAHISNARGFKPAKDISLPVKGKLKIKCKDGAVIPCGTLFTAELSETVSYSYRSTKTVEALRSGEVIVEATAPNTDIAKGELKHLIGDFATKENILRFRSKSVTNGTKKEDKGATHDISSYLYKYNLHILKKFSSERAQDSDILESFDEMKTAAALNTLLSGSSLEAKVLTKIRARDRQRLSNSSEQQLDSLGMENGKLVDGAITRKRFLTAAFLACGSKNVDNIFADTDDAKTKALSAQEVLSNSVAEINGNLRKCGFHELYLPNPFDCLIAYLTMCADPIEAYRTLFDFAHDYSDKKKEERKAISENEKVDE